MRGFPRLHYSLTIFSPEKFSIQRFESLEGNHLHLAFMCICLRVIVTVLNTVLPKAALFGHLHLPKPEKNLCKLKTPKHLIIWDDSDPDTKACRDQQETWN